MLDAEESPELFINKHGAKEFNLKYKQLDIAYDVNRIEPDEPFD